MGRVCDTPEDMVGGEGALGRRRGGYRCRGGGSGASLRPARILMPAVLAVALVLSSCVSVPPATARPAGREAAAMEPPPGGLVDSEPNVGWTQGEFSVGDDGAAQYSVPLWVPAGRGAVTPQLSLSYSSEAGNGLLGVGWSLGGLSAKSWCGRTIAQDGYTDGGHVDGTGALCLDGHRLVPISPPFSPVTEYRTERETFARIIAYETQDNVPNFFTVFTNDGMILTLGGSAEARVQPYLLIGRSLPEPSLMREIGDPRATTAWALDRFEYNNADQLHPTDIINGVGHRTVIETHSGLGVPLRIWDPNGVPITFRYDRFGRLRETNRSDGSFEHITHSKLGDQQLTTTTTFAGGGETAELVDQLGRTRERRVKTFDGRTATTYTDYDPVSRTVSRTSRPALPGETPQYTVTQYDNRGRVTSVTARDGA